MTFRKASVKQFVAIFVAAAAMGACLVRAERGQSADADPAAECPGAGKPESRYMDRRLLVSFAIDAKGNASGVASELATLDEFSTWDHRDRHRLATFTRLKVSRASAPRKWNRSSA